MPTDTDSRPAALVTGLVDAVWNDRDLDAADDLLADDYVGHGYDDGDIDREGYKAFVEKHFGLFPDLTMTVRNTVVEDDRVAAHWEITGTHEAPVLGIEPTGERVTVPGMTIYRIEDGHVADDWTIPDVRSLLRQLGAGPHALAGQQ
ncbi:ester cyclase [Halobacteriaceae archaeon GCM10025711]